MINLLILLAVLFLLGLLSFILGFAFGYVKSVFDNSEETWSRGFSLVFWRMRVVISPISKDERTKQSINSKSEKNSTD